MRPTGRCVVARSGAAGAPGRVRGGTRAVFFAAFGVFAFVDLAQLGEFLLARLVGGAGVGRRGGPGLRLRGSAGWPFDDDFGLVLRLGVFARACCACCRARWRASRSWLVRCRSWRGFFGGLFGGFRLRAALFLDLDGHRLVTAPHGDILALGCAPGRPPVLQAERAFARRGSVFGVLYRSSLPFGCLLPCWSSSPILGTSVLERNALKNPCVTRSPPGSVPRGTSSRARP